MNTEAIIEQLLLSKNEQILNTPLEELHLSIRVHRGLWRSRVRTVRDVVEIWDLNRQARNVGERARSEILGALQVWCLSLPGFSNPDDAETRAETPGRALDRRSPIEALHLSQRTYRTLKRHGIDTLGDLYRDWDKLPSLWHVGQGTMDEIQKALDPSGRGLKIHSEEPAPMSMDCQELDQETHPVKNDLADRARVDGYGILREDLTQTHIISDSGAVVRADLLETDEPRKSREERWRNIPPKPQSYAPKNTFQAICEEKNKISDPIRRPKKMLDGSVPIATEWLEMSLYLLEKARTSRQLRTVNCPICMAPMRSIDLKQHLMDQHPQAYREVQKAATGSAGWQLKQDLVDTYTRTFQELKKASEENRRSVEAGLDPSQEGSVVKCPLCEHVDRYNALQAHLQDSHPAIDSKGMMTRFDRVLKCRDDKKLPRYQDELNELVRQYRWLTRGQEES